MQLKKSLTSAAVVLPIAFSIVVAQPDDTQDSNRPKNGERPARVAQKRPVVRRPALQPSRVQNIEKLKETLKKIGIKDEAIEKIADVTKKYNDFLAKQLVQVQKETLNIKEAILNSSDIAVIKPMVTRKSKIVADIEIAQIERDMAIKSLLTLDEFNKWKRSRQIAGTLKGEPGNDTRNPGQRKNVQKKMNSDQ